MRIDYTRWHQAIVAWPVSGPAEYKLARTLAGVLAFVDGAQWQGACHATTAVSTVLLREQDVEAQPYIGECKNQEGFFDHSWVEVNSLVYDVAIAMPLTHVHAQAPVFGGLSVDTKQPTPISYGVKSPSGYDDPAEMIRAISIADYMDAFPNHPEGLWGIAKIIGKSLGLRLNNGVMKKTYAELKWKERGA
ncbi:MAG TPA: hypothetical protein VM240_14870 [Verrucomicrobiae bacterium]|nr:hypothetical protein [Verrucomicrobiae bacterium]